MFVHAECINSICTPSQNYMLIENFLSLCVEYTDVLKIKKLFCTFI